MEGKKTIGVSSVNSAVVHGLESNGIELMVGLPFKFIKNPTKTTTLHAEQFFNTGVSSLTEQREKHVL